MAYEEGNQDTTIINMVMDTAMVILMDMELTAMVVMVVVINVQVKFILDAEFN